MLKGTLSILFQIYLPINDCFNDRHNYGVTNSNSKVDPLFIYIHKEQVVIAQKGKEERNRFTVLLTVCEERFKCCSTDYYGERYVIYLIDLYVETMISKIFDLL